MSYTLKDAIPIVMNRFDFEKTRKVMEFLNWSWAGDALPPTIDELKKCALYLLDGCVRMFEEKGSPQSGMTWATGGFEASVQTFEKSEPRLQLLFYVDQTSSSGEY